MECPPRRYGHAPLPGHPRITVDVRVLAGKPTIRGLRISVEQILRAVGNGVPAGDLLRDYPELEPGRRHRLHRRRGRTRRRGACLPGGGCMNAPLRVLVDACVGTAVEAWLRGGHDVAAVGATATRTTSTPTSWPGPSANTGSSSRLTRTSANPPPGRGLPHGGVLLLVGCADFMAKVRAIEADRHRFRDQLADHFSVYQNGKLRIR